MDQFVSVEEMIDRIRCIAEKHHKSRIFDRDIAALLRLEDDALAQIKHRNSNKNIIPPILKFCYRTGLDPMKILF